MNTIPVVGTYFSSKDKSVRINIERVELITSSAIDIESSFFVEIVDVSLGEGFDVIGEELDSNEWWALEKRYELFRVND